MARHAPENPLTAFDVAIALELAIELDIYQTRDGNLVVIHDPTVDRTTNGSGRVSDMTLDEIRKLDAGQWFHPRFSGLKIPTLDEVLRIIGEKQRRPLVWLGINMKIISPGIAEKIVRLVEKYDLLKQAFGFGQPPESSRRFKIANPKMKTTVV
ncbi:MAG: glycerophosphodiester phosphodiesterase family protein [Planctomycetota bacterium]|nr:glycerophosphodiester phosphodiesterase family protein [Planctomycetota bacterium]